MSGGEVVVAPLALAVVPVVAAAAVVVIGAGLAAALVIKTAQVGTEAAGRALERFGEESERAANAQDEAALRSRLWGLAAEAVVEVNAERSLLAARAERAGVRVSLPAPVDLTGQSLADVRAWAARAQQAMAEARRAVEQAEAGREQQRLLDRLPRPADDGPTVAETLARYGRVLAARRSRTVPKPPAVVAQAAATEVDRERVRADIDAILARLHVNANADEREQAILAAARAAQQRQAGLTRTFVNTLARVVDAEINPKVARREDAARLLAGLEHQVVTDAIAETSPLPPHLVALERLRAVVSGDADLTDDDRRTAKDALVWAERQAERRRLLDLMAESFAGLGYAVTTGMQVNHTETLCVTRGGWGGDHTADIWVDAAGRPQWRLVELQAGASAEAARCEELNETMRKVGDKLADQGFDATVIVPDELIKPVRRHDGRPPAETPRVIDHEAPAVRAIDLREEQR